MTQSAATSSTTPTTTATGPCFFIRSTRSVAPVAAPCAPSQHANTVRGIMPTTLPTIMGTNRTPVAASTRLVNANGEFGGKRSSATSPMVRGTLASTSAARTTPQVRWPSMKRRTASPATRRDTDQPMSAPPT